MLLRFRQAVLLRSYFRRQVVSANIRVAALFYVFPSVRELHQEARFYHSFDPFQRNHEAFTSTGCVQSRPSTTLFGTQITGPTQSSLLTTEHYVQAVKESNRGPSTYSTLISAMAKRG